MSQYKNAMSYARNAITAAALGAASVGAAYAQPVPLNANSAATTIAPYVQGTNGKSLAQNHQRRVEQGIVHPEYAKFRLMCVKDSSGVNQFRVWTTEIYTELHKKKSTDGLRSNNELNEAYVKRDAAVKSTSESIVSDLEKTCSTNKEWDTSRMFSLTDGNRK